MNTKHSSTAWQAVNRYSSPTFSSGDGWITTFCETLYTIIRNLEIRIGTKYSMRWTYILSCVFTPISTFPVSCNFVTIVLYTTSLDRGAFNNYVDQILPNFEPPSNLSPLSGKNGHYTLFTLCYVTPPLTFHWPSTPPPSSCPRSYWMTPLYGSADWAPPF